MPVIGLKYETPAFPVSLNYSESLCFPLFTSTQLPLAAGASLHYVDRSHQNDHNASRTYSSPLPTRTRRRCDRIIRLNRSEHEPRPLVQSFDTDPGGVIHKGRFRHVWKMGLVPSLPHSLQRVEIRGFEFRDMDTCRRFFEPRYHYMGLDRLERERRPS
jgi:hypothetical protein